MIQPNMNYTWNEHTLNSFKEMNNKISGDEMFSDVYRFVENHCQLEEGDSIAMLVADLLTQIYN